MLPAWILINCPREAAITAARLAIPNVVSWRAPITGGGNYKAIVARLSPRFSFGCEGIFKLVRVVYYDIETRVKDCCYHDLDII